MYLFMYLFSEIINIFYEDHIGNKYTFACFNVFIFSNIIYIRLFFYLFSNKLNQVRTICREM